MERPDSPLPFDDPAVAASTVQVIADVIGERLDAPLDVRRSQTLKKAVGEVRAAVAEQRKLLNTVVADVDGLKAAFDEPDALFDDWLDTIVERYHLEALEDDIKESAGLTARFRSLWLAWCWSFGANRGPFDQVQWHEALERAVSDVPRLTTRRNTAPPPPPLPIFPPNIPTEPPNIPTE
ncbi:MAG: hypothetical protein LBK54_06700 [Propionibacteriaceae bacterium]|jgi:hypothetical protein|nr:hypothetical protein [Propionibacteriaceae bacterium]